MTLAFGGLIPALLIVAGIAVFLVGTFSAAASGGVDLTTFGLMVFGVVLMGLGFLLARDSGGGI